MMLTFSVNTVSWANNYSIRPHCKAKILNNIWNLNLTPKIRVLLGILFNAPFLTRILISISMVNICPKNGEVLIIFSEIMI